MRKNAAERQREQQMTWEEEARKREERIQALQGLTIEELKAELDKRARLLLAAEIENLPSLVSTLVHQNAKHLLLALLGFEESFGRWEVKRNGDRASPIAAAIGEMAMQQVQLAIPDFIKEFMTTLSKEEFIQGAGRKDFKWQLNRAYTDHVIKWIEEEAKTKSQETISRLKIVQEKK